MDYFGHHARSQAALQTRLSGSCPSVIWKGNKVAVIPGTAQRRADLSSGGLQLNADFRFDALVASFGYDDASKLKTDLTLAQSIIYLSDGYKVEQVDIHPGGLAVTVLCNSLSQRA